VAKLIAIVTDENDGRVPDIARQVLQVMINHIEDIHVRIVGLEKQVLAWHKSNPVSQRLATIPGIGPIIATTIAATVTDPNTFRSGREFAVWLGLVPRQNSTGGKARLGRVSSARAALRACVQHYILKLGLRRKRAGRPDPIRYIESDFQRVRSSSRRAACGGYCCKSRKLQRSEFLART
jgi:transposase